MLQSFTDVPISVKIRQH